MAPKFEPIRDILDLSGKIILVTGGNSGIGYETVKMMLRKNARVYLAARSPSKGNEAIAQLETETGKRAEFLELDLADLKSVRKAADTFLAKESKLDIMFNNGGVMTPPVDQLTAQGYDLQFGTNVLGHFFLTELLLPALTASHAHSSVPARIINISSSAYSVSPKRDIFFDAIKGGPARDALVKKWGNTIAPWNLYGASKAGNILLSNHYAKNHSDVLVSCALHPGYIQSGLQRNSMLLKCVASIVFSPANVGAYTQLWAGTTASAEEINGKFFVPVGVPKTPGGAPSDTELEAEVVAYMKEAVKEF
ncbi:NAD(P)-binding protein [Mycena albidolilacea]|uniref:NAD(P)-binding protein n=1 Tax=Mycena albidolilacea TaxID=1033008 RepID=A0AAD7A3K7_9AGAR|nr:NAD(P)-binding protein [Mycena albidolilacea]